MTRQTAIRKLDHAFEHLRPLATGDTLGRVAPNAEALAMSTIARAQVDLIRSRPHRHKHYRPYFTFKNGREKFGAWHHSRRKAWEELRRIIHGTDCQWANADCLAQNGYGVEAYYVARDKGDCRGDIAQTGGVRHAN